MTAFGIVLTSQLLDIGAYVLAAPIGRELNPLPIGPLIIAKLVAAVVVGVIVARRRPSLAPVLALIGCAGCLSGLVVVL